MSKQAVFICTTDNYYIGLALMWLSQFHKSKIADKVDLYWFVNNQKTKELLGDVDDVRIEVIGSTATENYTTFDDDFYYGMSMRVWALEKLRTQYDRCIYFDVDTAINGDLTPYLEVNLKGKQIGGVPDWPFARRGGHKRNMINPEWVNIVDEMCEVRTKLAGNYLDYINSGVLIVDCKSINFNLTERYEALMVKKEFHLPDQDFFNSQFTVKVLPDEYNYMSDQLFTLDGPARIQDNISSRSAYVVHYHAGAKPWVTGREGAHVRMGVTQDPYMEIFEQMRPVLEQMPVMKYLISGTDANKKIYGRTKKLIQLYMDYNE